MEYLIDFKNDVSTEEIDNFIANTNCTILKQFSAYEKTFLVDAEAKPPITEIIDDVIENQDITLQLLSYPNAQGKDYPETKFTTEDDYNWWKLASIIKLNFSLVTQTFPRRGNSAIIYLVDSGVKTDHKDFQLADIENLHSFNNDFTDYNGHGTALASVMCGDICSIGCPLVKSVKIFQAGTPTLQSDLLAAFDAIIDDVKNTTGKLHIVNLSWSVPKNEYIEQKIRLLIKSGALIVASAGNNGIPIQNVTPASMKEVFTVGAYNKDFMPCDFSNYTGDLSTNTNQVNYGALDVWAPGEEIRVAKLNGEFGIESGTSLAAALCSAALAYNSFSFEQDDGSIPFFATDSQIDLRAHLSMKRDYLTLEEKYSSSENAIISFLQKEKDDEVIKYGRLVGVQAVYYSDEPISLLLAPGHVYTTASLNSEIPTGLYVSGRYLHGSVTNNTNDIIHFVGHLTRTRYDNSIEYAKFNLVILPKKILDKYEWINDPIQNVVLDFGCFPSGSGCDGSCQGSGFCYDLGEFCGLKDPICVCTASACP